jgi:hypothetical protein
MSIDDSDNEREARKSKIFTYSFTVMAIVCIILSQIEVVTSILSEPFSKYGWYTALIMTIMLILVLTTKFLADKDSGFFILPLMFAFAFTCYFFLGFMQSFSIVFFVILLLFGLKMWYDDRSYMKGHDKKFLRNKLENV